MKLTTEQKESVAAWVASGATLNEIQDRLKSELGVILTFMDTRFLLSDLGLSLQPPADEAEPDDDIVAPDPGLPDAGMENGAGLHESAGEDAAEAEAIDEPAGGTASQVRVTVDTVTLPGTMVSGKVTFSDGVSGGWYLDQVGQLGLTGIPRSYQPPEADVVAFQRELRRALR